MAEQGGFEPPYNGTKTRCLTAWLLPSVSNCIYDFLMAEREGFEPSVKFYPYSRLAGVCLKPARPPLQNGGGRGTRTPMGETRRFSRPLHYQLYYSSATVTLLMSDNLQKCFFLSIKIFFNLKIFHNHFINIQIKKNKNQCKILQSRLKNCPKQ